MSKKKRYKVVRRFDIYEDLGPDVGGTYIGTTRGNGELPESVQLIDEENAKLFAASPEMYRLIRKCYKVLHMGVWEVEETDQEVCEQINDVMWNHFGDDWRPNADEDV